MSGVHKGNAWEREVARDCTKAFGVPCERNPFQGFRGTKKPDVSVPGLWVEAKHSKRLDMCDPFKAHYQGDRDARAMGSTDIVVAVCKLSRVGAVAVWRGWSANDWVDWLPRFSVPTMQIALAAMWKLEGELMIFGDHLIANYSLWLDDANVAEHVTRAAGKVAA